jgi:hypothetical protein
MTYLRGRGVRVAIISLHVRMYVRAEEEQEDDSSELGVNDDLEGALCEEPGGRLVLVLGLLEVEHGCLLLAPARARHVALHELVNDDVALGQHEDGEVVEELGERHEARDDDVRVRPAQHVVVVSAPAGDRAAVLLSVDVGRRVVLALLGLEAALRLLHFLVDLGLPRSVVLLSAPVRAEPVEDLDVVDGPVVALVVEEGLVPLEHGTVGPAGLRQFLLNAGEEVVPVVEDLVGPELHPRGAVVHRVPASEASRNG